MFAALTGIGLSAAAGLNAYIPLMVVGLLDRYTNLVSLPDAFAWLAEPWALIGVGVLLVAEFFLDKVPVVDHVNDAVQTFVRPAVGGVIFAATTAAEDLENSTWVQERPWIPIVAGVVVAGLVHGAKATARPVVNTTTGGTGTPVVSVAEDVAALGMSLVAVLAPVLVLVFLGGFLWAVIAFWRRRRRRRRAGVITPEEPGQPVL